MMYNEPIPATDMSSAAQFYPSHSSPNGSMRHRKSYLEYSSSTGHPTKFPAAPDAYHNMQNDYLNNNAGRKNNLASRKVQEKSIIFSILCLLLPPLMIVYFVQLPGFAQVALNIAFVLWYSMDLSNVGLDLSLGLLWGGLFACPSFINLLIVFVLDYASEENDGSLFDILMGSVSNLMECGMQNTLWLALVGFMTLQYEHFSAKNDPLYSLLVKLCLYAVLPVLSSSVVAGYISYNLVDYSPGICYIFTLAINTGILTATSDVFEIYGQVKNENESLADDLYLFQLVSWICIPVLVHFVTFGKNILSDRSDIYDMLISSLFPISMLIFLSKRKLVWWCSHESVFARSSRWRLHNIAFLILYLLLQQRYLVPSCLDLQFYINGGVAEQKGAFIISLILILGMFLISISYHVYHNMTDFFGEYYEDVSLCLLSLGILFLCIAVGLPWSVMPSIVLGCVSLVLFYVSEQVRYLLIFLLVLALSLSIMIMFRVAFFRSLTIAGISLLKFGYIAIIAIVILGITIGFTFRAPGGWGSKINFDSVGILLIGYSILLTFLESALVGSSFDNNMMLLEYPVHFSVVTSVLLYISTYNLQRQGKVSRIGAYIVHSFSLGKLASYLSSVDDNLRNYCVSRSIVASCLFLVISLPHYFSNMMEIRTNHSTISNSVRFSSSGSKKRMEISIILLPFVLLLSSRMIVKPLLQTLYLIIDQNKRDISLIEVIGCCLAIWGMSNLTVVAGSSVLGKGFTKSSSMLFLIGIILIFGGQSMDIFGDINANEIIEEDFMSRTKVLSKSWGFVLFVSLVMCVLGGPLDFRPSLNLPRRSFSKTRALIFSAILGAGLVLLNVDETLSDKGLFTSIFTYMNTAYGIYIAAFYRYSEEQSAKSLRVTLWIISSTICCLQSFLFCDQSVAYSLLFLDGIILFLISVSIKKRAAKTPALIDTANNVGILSWIVSSFASYIRFGLIDSGDLVINRMFGIPTSLLCSILGSSSLLFVDAKFITSDGMRTTFRQADDGGTVILFIVGNSISLFIVSVYTILFRGCSKSANTAKIIWEEMTIPDSLARVVARYDASVISYLPEASFCTAATATQPILYCVSLICLCPILYQLIYSLKNRMRPQATKMVYTWIPLYIVSLLLSRGFVHLFMLNLFAIIGYISDVYTSKLRQRKRNMKI